MAKNTVEFDYFHDFESEQFAFYRIPKVLFKGSYFKDLSCDAKVLYGLMLDRMSLSIQNQWFDEENKVYIIYTLEQVMEDMNCKKDKGIKLLAELDTDKGIGLIERVKQGFGKPALIYVKSFIIKEEISDITRSEKPKYRGGECRSTEVDNSEVPRSEKPKSLGEKCRSTEVGKTEVTGSEKPKSQGRKNRSIEVGNSAPNNTNINNTDFNNTNLINQSEEPEQDKPIDKIDEMTEIQIYKELIKENIEYEHLINNGSIGDCGYIDEMVELLVETICIKREHIRIAGADHPYQLVKGKLLKLNSSHITYVLDCLHNNTTKVRNVKAYLLTSLYNAPSTIDSYYRAEVNHDMYGVD